MTRARHLRSSMASMIRASTAQLGAILAIGAPNGGGSPGSRARSVSSPGRSPALTTYRKDDASRLETGTTLPSASTSSAPRPTYVR